MLWVVMSTVMVVQQPLIHGTLQKVKQMCWMRTRFAKLVIHVPGSVKNHCVADENVLASRAISVVPVH